MQRIYIDLGRDPHTAHAALTGSASPSLAGVLGAPLDLAVAFFRNGEQEALASGATGKLVLKKSGARAGDALLLDTTMTAEGTGAATIYKFSGTLSSAEIISALAENDSLTLKASVAWTEPGADERVALDCDFVLHNSASRPDDAAPANTAASELWLDDRVIRYLPAVVGLTGGGGTKLDGLATTAKDAGEAVAVFDDSASSVLRVYELVAGSDAESTPDVIRPDDFHATTNAKVWKLRADATAATLAAHTANTSNPHAVTKTQVGLGNCDNTSDASKPVSTATQTALDAKEAAQTAASQAEAEAGTEGAIRKFSPLRIAQAIAALGGSGSAVTTPKVLHVTTAGNDTTGDGSLAAPYLTAQKAFDVAFAGSGDFVLQLGVGAFGSINCESGWPARIFLRGAGASVCSLAFISSATGAEGHTAAGIDLRSDKSVTVSGVNASGTGATTASGAGGSAGAITLIGVVHGSVEAIGGDGGPESDPGISGDGGSGGDGGGITLRDCVKSAGGDFSAAGGAAGTGGTAGAHGNVYEALCEHRQPLTITCADRLALMCLLSTGDTVNASGTNTETGCVTE